MSDGVRKLVTFAHSQEVPVYRSSYREAPFSCISCDNLSQVYLVHYVHQGDSCTVYLVNFFFENLLEKWLQFIATYVPYF